MVDVCDWGWCHCGFDVLVWLLELVHAGRAHGGIFMLVRLGVVHRGRSQHNAMLLAWGCFGVLGWCRLVRMRQAVGEALVPWVGAGWCALGACAVLLAAATSRR